MTIESAVIRSTGIALRIVKGQAFNLSEYGVAFNYPKENLMRASTWMDPLIKAQRSKRRAGSHRSPVVQSKLATDTSGAWGASGRSERGRRSVSGLDQELAQWDDDPMDTLPEMELAVGMADWIDPQTGTPAEGQSPLRIGLE